MTETKKQIRFINSHYKELFKISDGDNIRIIQSDGKTSIRQCRYIDECHTQVGSYVFHICEFAEKMEQCGNTYEPERYQMPQFCYGTIPSSGELIIIKYGERGYFRSEFSTPSVEINRILASDKNDALGVTKAQAAAM